MMTTNETFYLKSMSIGSVHHHRQAMCRLLMTLIELNPVKTRPAITVPNESQHNANACKKLRTHKNVIAMTIDDLKE